MTNAKLIDQAQDSRETLLTAAELETLWTQAHAALCAGSLSEAFPAVEALLCQAGRGNVVPDCLPEQCGPFFKVGFAMPQIQGLFDRVESLNAYIGA